MKRGLLARHHAESRLLVLFLAAAAALLGLAKAASEVIEGDTLAIDRTVLLALRRPGDPAIPIGPRWLEEAVVQITALGGAPVLTLVTLLAAGFLLAVRKQAFAALTIGAVSGGALLAEGLKRLYGRPRPDVVSHLVDTHSLSFPSAHAMNAAVVYLTLGVLLARTQASPAVRVYVFSSAILLALLVGMSRIYLGVHWPTDVIAGWIVGAAWAAGCALVAKRLAEPHSVER